MSLNEASPRQVELTYAQAVNAALRRALADSPEVLVFGEDVARPGGVFGCTRDLQRDFGPERVFDTPISESAILGAALGTSLFGRRPVVEVMWVDFSLVALDQLVNQAANVRYVSNGRLHAPLTVRTQEGALPGSCAQHSQNLEAFFAHVPGLRVAMPGTPQDAYDLLLAAVECNDPAIVIENRGLYHSRKASVSLDGPVQPVGGARIRRTGKDATVVALGAMQWAALTAADELAAQGIEIEVIDPRWLSPLDDATILASVKRTARLVVAHEANRTGGFGAEIAARVAQHGFEYLDAPIERVAVSDLRIPAAPHLQAAVLPDAATIADAVRRTVEF